MMDRFDLLAVAGVGAMVIGFVLVHPALLLVAAGYVVVSNAQRRAS